MPKPRASRSSPSLLPMAAVSSADAGRVIDPVSTSTTSSAARGNRRTTRKRAASGGTGASTAPVSSCALSAESATEGIGRRVLAARVAASHARAKRLAFVEVEAGIEARARVDVDLGPGEVIRVELVHQDARERVHVGGRVFAWAVIDGMRVTAAATYSVDALASVIVDLLYWRAARSRSA